MNRRDVIIRMRRRAADLLAHLATRVDSQSWTQAEWDAWHNPPCPPVEEREISGVFRCVTMDVDTPNES